MDQDLALKLFEEGATLFLFNSPKSMEFGIDLNSWNIGEKFLGVKMIPPGLHFIYYSAMNSEGSIAPRTGFFHHFKRREILVKTWCSKEEDFIDSTNDEEKVEHLQAKLKDFDKNLGSYPFELWKKWISLSNKLDCEVVDRVQPIKKKIASVPFIVSTFETVENQPDIPRKQRIGRKNLEESMLPQMVPCPETELRFTSIPESSFPIGSSASQITHFSLDTSYILEQIMSAWSTYEKLLGELQMAFLCFLVGQVYSAFEQWKSLVNIICRADEYLLKNPMLFKEFISDLYFQMQEVPTDFFVDTISRENFLTDTLRILFGNVNDNKEVDQGLKRKCLQLQNYLEKRFDWNFTAEPDDEAPVVVVVESEENI